MPAIDLVVVGGSAGGLPALLELVGDLPTELSAAICVVLHTSPSSPGKLAQIVGRKTLLACVGAEDGQSITAGVIYFAAVDRHLLVENGSLRVTHGPRENGFRPAVDPLFRTAARWFGPRAAGIVLSGSLGDGSAGLAAIKKAGGITIVQDPDEAIIPSMPRSALAGVEIDYVLKAAEMAALIERLAAQKKGVSVMPSQPIPDADPAEWGTDLSRQAPEGELTPFTCPECGGSLWEQKIGGPHHFRCHVGHAYNGESMLHYHSQKVEAALWAALRVLEEHAMLQERMATRFHDHQLSAIAQACQRSASDCRQQAKVLRDLLLSSSAAPLLADDADFDAWSSASKSPEDIQ